MNNKIYVAYTDGYYEEWGRHYSHSKEAIKIKGIFSSAEACLKACNGEDWKVKAYILNEDGVYEESDQL